MINRLKKAALLAATAAVALGSALPALADVPTYFRDSDNTF